MSTESMIERAAKAAVWAGRHRQFRSEDADTFWDDLVDEELRNEHRALARAAILAALDLSDEEIEALTRAALRASGFTEDQCVDFASTCAPRTRAILTALRASASVEDVPPQENVEQDLSA